MAGILRLKFRREAFRELRSEETVVEDLKQRAERVAQAAGEGVEVLPVQHPRQRAHLVVAPVTEAANSRVARDNSLIKALDAGR